MAPAHLPARLLLIALALGTPMVLAGTPTPVLVPTAIQATAGVATTPTGLHVTATLHAEDLVGFPVVASLTVRNDSASTQTFPDLAARPHLVHFSLSGPRGKSERYNTPPAFDVASVWTLSPHAERSVLLEIPSSSGFPAGDYTVSITVQDPGGTLVFPAVPMTLVTPHPVTGTPVWEPTIAQNLGTIFPWVQDRAGASGTPASLYLMQFDARAQTRPVAQYWLADLPAIVTPVLSRSRAGDSFARYVYWLLPNATATTLGFGRLDGTAMRPAKTASLPYPNVELYDRGITDGKGQLVMPVWIPSPSGTGGSLKVWTVNERGVQSLRSVVDLPARPEIHATAIDAASNLLIAIGVTGGVDVYRVDPTQPADIPAKGTRHWATVPGWAAAGVTFDVLPDAGTRAGGLSLFALLRSTGTGPAQWKSQWSDLGGEAFAPLAGDWTLPGTLKTLVTAGYSAFYAMSQDATGAWWYQPLGGTSPAAAATVLAAKTLDGASLFISGDVVRARVLGGADVVTDITLGPKVP